MGKKKKNQPANAGDMHGFDPQSGKIPHADAQLSLCATISACAPRTCALPPEKPLQEALASQQRVTPTEMLMCSNQDPV